MLFVPVGFVKREITLFPGGCRLDVEISSCGVFRSIPYTQ
jgi:hypothetical protein